MAVLLLWDIDGTLIRGRGIGKRAMDAAFWQQFGVERAFDGIGMAGGLDLHFILHVFRERGIGEDQLPRFLELYYEALRREMEVSEVAMQPAVVETLERCAADPRLYNALGTGNLEPGARIKLEPFDLNRFFPVGGFCDALVERYELLQAGVEKSKAHFGVDFAPQEVIVIGDTLRDIEAARKIGARVVAVATGGHSYEDLEAGEPDLLLRDLSDPRLFAEFEKPLS